MDGKKSNNTFENDGISLALKPSAPTKLNPCPNLKILPIIIPIIAATPVVPSNIPSVLIPIDFKVSKFLSLIILVIIDTITKGTTIIFINDIYPFPTTSRNLIFSLNIAPSINPIVNAVNVE